MGDLNTELKDMEFELLFRGTVTKEDDSNLFKVFKGPKTDYTTLLRFNYGGDNPTYNQIICYQDFSSKTKKANNEPRTSFALPGGYSFFSHIYENTLKQKGVNYKPSGIFRYLDQLTSHTTVVLDMIFHTEDNYVYIVIENTDKCITNKDLIILATNSEVTLNLSSLPFNLLNQDLYISKNIPNLSSVTSKQMASNSNNIQKKDQTQSFLLSDVAASISKDYDDSITIVLTNPKNLTAYPQWSINTKDFNAVNLRETGCVDLVSFVEKVNRHNIRFGDQNQFTPTATLYLNDSTSLPIIGVITNMTVSDRTGRKSKSSVNQKKQFTKFIVQENQKDDYDNPTFAGYGDYEVRLTLNFKDMNNYSPNNLYDIINGPVYNEIYNVPIYMNIDDAPVFDEIDVSLLIKQNGIINQNQSLYLPDSEGKFLTYLTSNDIPSQSITNNGLIYFSPFSNINRNTPSNTGSQSYATSSSGFGGIYKTVMQNDIESEIGSGIELPNSTSSKSKSYGTIKNYTERSHNGITSGISGGSISGITGLTNDPVDTTNDPTNHLIHTTNETTHTTNDPVSEPKYFNLRSCIYVPDNFIFTNNGIISLYDKEKNPTSGTFSVDTLFSNKSVGGNINLYDPLYDDIGNDNDIVTSYIAVSKNNAIFQNSGLIYFNTNVNLTYDSNYNFTYITDVYNKFGRIWINSICNKCDIYSRESNNIPTISCIRNLVQNNQGLTTAMSNNSTVTPSHKTGISVAGFNIKSLNSQIYIGAVMGVGPTAVTYGIENCYGNNGNIIIDYVSTMDPVRYNLSMGLNSTLFKSSNNEFTANGRISSDYRFNQGGVLPFTSTFNGNKFRNGGLVNATVNTNYPPNMFENLSDASLYGYNQGYNGYKFNNTGYQITYGIKNVGCINPTSNKFQNNKLVQLIIGNGGTTPHSMVTPNSFKDGFGNIDLLGAYQMPLKADIFLDSNSDIITEVSGNYGNIIINNVINCTCYENNEVNCPTGGINSMLQLSDGNISQNAIPRVEINFVANYTWGGNEYGSSASGISNVLLNKGNIYFNVINNYNPQNAFSNDESSSTVGSDAHNSYVFYQVPTLRNSTHNVSGLGIVGLLYEPDLDKASGYQETNFISKYDLDVAFSPNYYNNLQSVTTGIRNCVQNGYSCLNPTTDPDDNNGNLLYAFIPPYPPQNYKDDGLISQPTQPQSSSIQYYSILSINDDYDPDSSSTLTVPSFKVNYESQATENLVNQGSIFINSINSYSQSSKGTAQGILRYGGYSYNTDYFDPQTSEGVIDITEFLFKFVQINTNPAIVWNFPTSVNTDPSNSGLYDDMTGYTSEKNLKQIGWWPNGQARADYLTNSYSPTQMYYAYKPTGGSDDTGMSSNMIYFPMNWGSVNIVSVNNGQFMNNVGLRNTYGNIIASKIPYEADASSAITVITNAVAADSGGVVPDIITKAPSNWKNVPTYKSQAESIPGLFQNSMLGITYTAVSSSSAFGIKKVVTSIGRIEIVNITSIYPITGLSGTNKYNIFINTPENPQLSNAITPFNDDVYFDLTVDGAVTENVESVNINNTFIDLSATPIPTLISRNGILPTTNHNQVNQRINANVDQYFPINKRTPYSVLNKLIKTGDVYYSPLDSSFDEILTTNDNVNILPALHPNGSSYGVYRTINYGTKCPGLVTQMEFGAKPFMVEPNPTEMMNEAFPTQIYQPYTPTIPGGMNFSSAIYDGVYVDQGEGGFAINTAFAPLYNNADLSLYGIPAGDELALRTATPLIGVPARECKGCVLYILPNMNNGYFYYNQAGAPDNEWINVTPLIMADLAAPGMNASGSNSIEWVLQRDSNLAKMTDGGNESDVDTTNSNGGAASGADYVRVTWPQQGASGTYTTYVDDDTELNPDDDLYIWNGNNNTNNAPGAFQTTALSGNSMQLYTINPIRVYGGLWQFISYWNAMINHDPVTGYFYGSGFGDWTGEINSKKPFYGSYVGDSAQIVAATTFSSGPKPINTNWSIDRYSLDLQSSQNQAGGPAQAILNGTESSITLNGVENLLGEADIWTNYTPNNINHPRIFNNKISAIKKNYNLALPQKINIYNGIDLNENAIIDTFSSPFTTLQTWAPDDLGLPIGKPFLTVDSSGGPPAGEPPKFAVVTGTSSTYGNSEYIGPTEYPARWDNKYWYQGGPDFRGWNPTISNSFPTAGLGADYTAHLWNTLQSNCITIPKYLWYAEGKPLLDVDQILDDEPNLTNTRTGTTYGQVFRKNLPDSNIFPSYYSGLTNMPTLFRSMGFAENKFVGFCGPYNNYYSYRKDSSGNELWPENYMPYHYSASCPIGFNPQFIQGNVLYLKPYANTQSATSYDIKGMHWIQDLMGTNESQPILGGGNSPNVNNDIYNTILVTNYASNGVGVGGGALPDPNGNFLFCDPTMINYFLYGGAIGIDTFDIGITGFSSISSGNSSFMEQNQNGINQQKNILETTQTPSSSDNVFINCYQSIDIDNMNTYVNSPNISSIDYDFDYGPYGNSYYGLTFESVSFDADRNYYFYYMQMGPLLQYSNLMNNISSIDGGLQTTAFSNYESNLNNYDQWAAYFQLQYETMLTKNTPATEGGEILDTATSVIMDTFQVAMICVMSFQILSAGAALIL